MGRKTENRHFLRQTSEISQGNYWTGLRKGNRKKKTESLRKAALSHAIRTNYIKANIDKTQNKND